VKKRLSDYKFKKIATESFRNGLRLHFDSILLHNHKSYPSAYQLSVLALEEFSKSNWVEHYYNSSKYNGGFPDVDFEQDWLKLLYFHPRKQNAFFGWGMDMDYSPKFVKFVKDRKLEEKKQQATYVGLKRTKNIIDTTSQISIPFKIKENDSKQIVSMLNDYLKEICIIKDYQEYYFDLADKDELITSELLTKLNEWKYKSGLKSNKWFFKRMKNYS
tara:strand:+ start:6873 stop:7523 length:651 start_codon:yes stop_codon:yes gene_type:complete